MVPVAKNASAKRRVWVPAAVAIVLVAAAFVPALNSGAASKAASPPQVEQAVRATGTGPVLTLPAWSPRARELTIVAVASQAWRRPALTVTGNGLHFDQLGAVRNAQGIETLTVFRAQGSPTRGPVTVALPGNTGPAVAIGLRLSNVLVGGNGTEAVRSLGWQDGPSDDEGDNANMMTSVQASSGDLVLALGTNRIRRFVVPPNQTPIVTDPARGVGGARIAASAWSRAVPVGGRVVVGGVNDLTGNSGADDWAIAALAVRGAGSAPPGPTPSHSPTPSPTPSLSPSTSASSSQSPTATQTRRHPAPLPVRASRARRP